MFSYFHFFVLSIADRCRTYVMKIGCFVDVPPPLPDVALLEQFLIALFLKLFAAFGRKLERGYFTFSLHHRRFSLYYPPTCLHKMTRLFNFTLISALATIVSAQTLNVVNKCSQSVFLNTVSSSGTIANDVTLAAGATKNMGISSNWNGAINVGTGCDSSGSTCTTGGPTWDGKTPFSRAEVNFAAVPGSVTYDISLIYGYNVGMEIAGCEDFACTLPSGCPVTGPGGSCFSGCCASAAACSGGALPASGGGCPGNKFAGPHSDFFFNNCPNAYAFPDNDGSNGGKPANNIVTTCKASTVTVTLCPGTTSHIPK